VCKLFAIYSVRGCSYRNDQRIRASVVFAGALTILRKE